MNSRINKLHERALRLVYDDHSSTFQDILILDGSFTIHERNIQNLAIEIFKVICNIAPDIMKEVFILKNFLSTIYLKVDIFAQCIIGLEHCLT